MSNHKLMMENWRRFLKENKEPTLEEVLDSLPLEEGVGLVGGFMALVGMSEGLPQGMQGIEIEGQNYTIEQIAHAHDKLEKLAANDKHASGAKAGQETLRDAVIDASNLQRDSDEDGFYELIFPDWGQSADEGKAYGLAAVKNVTKATKPVPQPATDTGSPTKAMKGGNIDAQAEMLLQIGQQKMSPEQRVDKAEELLKKGKEVGYKMSPETEKALNDIIKNNSK